MGSDDKLKAEIEQLRKADEAKRRVLKVLGRVTAEETQNAICRAIVEGVREELNFDRVGLFLWDDAIDWYRGTYGTDLEGRTSDERHVIWAIKPQYLEKIREGAVFVRGCILGEPEPMPGEENIKAELVVFRHQGEVIGVISVDNRISRRPIEQEELEPLTLLNQVIGNMVLLSRAHDALARSEERFRQIAETSGEWIWEMDPDGCYTYCSPVVETILGYTPEEMQGRSYTDFVKGDEVESVSVTIREAFDRREKIECLAHAQIRRNRSLVHLETFAIPMLNEKGDWVGYRGVHRDVTHERHLEEQLRQRIKMEAIGRLAGGIAHDFNNILTSILGCVSLLLEELGEGDPIRTDIEMIRTAGERAASLTHQLLAFSRRQVMTVQEVQVNGVVADMEVLFQRVLGENIELVTKLEDDLPWVKADADQLRQVLLQLAVNARDSLLRLMERRKPASEDFDGRVTLQTASVTLNEAFCREHPDLVPGDYAVITVEDNGEGLSEELLEHVFDPFFNAETAGVEIGRLGLAPIYGIVKQMSGHVEVQSESGRGTRFDIYLPFWTASSDTQALPPAAPRKKAGGERILVVEDEAAVRKLTARMLTMLGYQTLEASNGAEAMALYAQHEGGIDLIITDMIMPKMSGKQLVEKLRSEGRQIKALFVSGYSADDTVDGQPLGADMSFIQKPFTRDVLAKKVEDMLSRPN